MKTDHKKDASSLAAQVKRGQEERKNSYLRQARAQISLAELYLKDLSGKYSENDILLACERAIDYMDAFLEVDYSITSLLTTYVDGCKSTILLLLTVNTEQSISKGIELCERFGRRITAEKAKVNKNEAITEIALLCGSLYAAKNAHSTAIEYYELAAQIREIQAKANSSKDSAALLAECYLVLTVAHIRCCDLMHYGKALDCYLKGICIYVKQVYKGKLWIRTDADSAFQLSFSSALNPDSYEFFPDDASSPDKITASTIQLSLCKNMAELQDYADLLFQKHKLLSLEECIEALMKYVSVVNTIPDVSAQVLDLTFLLAKKEECYLQLSDLLLEKGAFYESKKYADLATQIYLTNI